MTFIYCCTQCAHMQANHDNLRVHKDYLMFACPECGAVMILERLDEKVEMPPVPKRIR